MTIAEGTKFVGISADVNMTEKKSALSNKYQEVYTIEDIKNSIKPYKSYVATIQQYNDADPQVLDVAENDFPFDLTWTRLDSGFFLANTGDVEVFGDKTYIFVTQTNGNFCVLQSGVNDEMSIYVNAYETISEEPIDINGKLYVEVRVYN